jgi:hypothetical protein
MMMDGLCSLTSPIPLPGSLLLSAPSYGHQTQPASSQGMDTQNWISASVGMETIGQVVSIN